MSMTTAIETEIIESESSEYNPGVLASSNVLALIDAIRLYLKRFPGNNDLHGEWLLIGNFTFNCCGNFGA